MPRSYLRLTFRDDGDRSGKLQARAERQGFAGEGGAHFSIPQLEAFANSLLAYPVPSDPPIAISGGFWSKTRRKELDQEHLAIKVYPLDARGHIGVQVRVATELWDEARPESQNTARLQLITTYEPLARFSRALTALIHGSADEAMLECEDLD